MCIWPLLTLNLEAKASIRSETLGPASRHFITDSHFNSDSELQPSTKFEDSLKVTIERARTYSTTQRCLIGVAATQATLRSICKVIVMVQVPHQAPYHRLNRCNGTQSQSELTDGSQCQYGVVAPNTSHVQDTHAATGSHHQHETFDIGSAPNAAAYPNCCTPHSQDPAGGFYLILLQLELSYPGIIAPNTFQLQDPASSSYPTLASQLQVSTGSTLVTPFQTTHTLGISHGAGVSGVLL
ncbi:uncharacterized protein F5147DRAFT_660590 [Suillus discolor]|uniref:Uncharacterized protein n=1 Tax=Suillus discolor TaxID=1912936 RepID=A0A9P7EQG8_9AGAM|nr:uncharacterized protein F5147DRAFT_660590 [Suillus discolor]KAG2082071.1 hypothetical protein F5147DRAFT_660590 [Suillus discolor]